MSLSSARTADIAAAFFPRARQRLSLVPAGSADIGPGAGDHDADPGILSYVTAAPKRPAAVLVPVVARPEPTILLTLRSSALPDHAGQVAFPGGKIDAADESPLATALREAEEEIGLEEVFIEPIGYLDTYWTTTGFKIWPAVARIEPGFRLTLNHGEVDDAFEVPLGFLMNPENHQRHQREWKGTLRSYYAMPYGDRYIWGVTAGILRNLWQKVYG